MFFEPPKKPWPGWLARAALAATRTVTVAALAGVLTLAGCREPAAGGRPVDGRSAGDGRPRVVATTTVVADLVRQVGGDRIVVECLMPPGIDPHSYQATPRDADRLLRADLVVASCSELSPTVLGAVVAPARS
jgi:ABC-type Zn uptake system ZnuABC Zn-binding protein ZnuA